MEFGFWKNLKKPFFTIAPMADVTDAAFRRMIATYGKPDVMWTEFVSAEGLMRGGKEALLVDLSFTDAERPIVAQLFGANTETMRGAAKLCASLGFDGIDINMGCPDKAIEKQGAGAAMIKTPDRAREIIRAVKQGIEDAGKSIPVSVKTRIGYATNEIATWIHVLLNEDIAALTIHARTRKELSKVPARWEHIKEVVALRDALGKETLIIGNGDIESIHDGIQKAHETGADGVMVGRALFGNPWFFTFKAHKQVSLITMLRKVGARLLQYFGKKNRYWLLNSPQVSKEQRLRALLEHCELFESLLGERKSFAVMRKHFKAYVHGWPGAKELRMKLMQAEHATEVKEILLTWK